MYTLDTGQFSSDTFVTFNGEEFFESQSYGSLKNCIAVRFVFSAPGDAILFCNFDETDGCVIAFSSGIIDVRCWESAVQYNLKSNALNTDQYYFVEILFNISTGDAVLYVDGVDQKDSNTITGLTDINSTESIKIGGTNKFCPDVGINTIGLFSYVSEEDWFTTDVSDFVSQYDNYVLYMQNPNFPFGGPNAYQFLSESKQSYLQTPPGTRNLPTSIELDNLTVEPLVYFNARNYDNDDTPVDNFSIERVSGTDDIYEYMSEYTSDESALLTDVSYLSMDADLTASFGDMVIETVFKCEGITGYSYIFGYGLYASGKRMYLRAKNSTTEGLEFYINDGTNSESYSLPAGNIETNNWNHVFIILKRTGSLSIYINGQRIETKAISAIDETIFGSSDFFIGNIETQYNDDDIFVSMLTICEQYDWLSSSEHDTFVTDRYSDYQTGGINYHVPIPMTVYTWGDNLGTYPIIMTLDKDGIWQLQYVGSTKDDQLLGEFTINDGIYGIRLFSKFEEYGWSNFDDLQSQFVNIETLQIPKEYKSTFERIVLQTKPLSTWAILMIEWI